MTSRNDGPVPAGPEAKVIAGAGGATAGGVVAALLLWALDTYVFTGGPSGDTVPPVVTAAAVLLLGGAGSWIAAWAAPHTPRRDPHLQAAARDALAAIEQVNARLDELDIVGVRPRPITDVPLPDFPAPAERLTGTLRPGRAGRGPADLPDLPTGPAPGAPPPADPARDPVGEAFPPPVEPDGDPLR